MDSNLFSQDIISGKICLFHGNSQVKCSNDEDNLILLSEVRLKTLIEKSIMRNDILHIGLESLIHSVCGNLKFHENCISTYTSNTHIKRYLAKHKLAVHDNYVNDFSPCKRFRRSDSAQFVWKIHCLFCGELCSLNKDSKNPDRWREAFECGPSYKRPQVSSFKDRIMKVCLERQDVWGDEVRIRLCCVFDLQAEGARYHEDCRKFFMNKRKISGSQKKSSLIEDQPLVYLIEIMKKDLTKVWSSKEIYNKFVEIGGLQITRKTLVQKLSKEFGDALLVLSSPGIANILIFKNQASKILFVQKDDDNIETKNVAKKITQEIKNLSNDKNVYYTTINIQRAKSEVSPTLSKLLSEICGESLFETSLPSILIGNMITSCVAKRHTSLSVDLAVLIQKKKLSNIYMNMV